MEKLFAEFKLYFNKSWQFLRYYSLGLYDRLSDGHAFLLAGGLAFTLLICMVPFVLIIFAILGKILEIPNVRDQINIFIDNALPYPESAQMVKAIVFNRITEFRLFRSMAGYLGGIGIFLTASGLFSSMRTILNSIFGVTRAISFWIGKLRDFGMILLVVLFFLLSVLFFPILDIILNSVEEIEFLQVLHLSGLLRFVLSFFPFIIMVFIFYMLYAFVAYDRLPKRVVFVSSVSAAVLWEAAKQLFGYYITNFATLSKIYGTYIFLIVILFWIYYSSIIFIISAHIGQLSRERRFPYFNNGN